VRKEGGGLGSGAGLARTLLPSGCGRNIREGGTEYTVLSIFP